jgi:hypothetical protein
MKFSKVFIVIILIQFLVSCDNYNKKRSHKNNASEWIGKTIQFPEKMNFSIYGRDTTFLRFYNSSYKILFFADSTGCTGCKLHLSEWKRLITEVETSMADKVSFVFCLQPKSSADIVYFLRRERFKYPVMIDKENYMNSLNHFPEQLENQCFLLDKNNKVVLIGNPVYKSAIWELYKKVINEKSL